MTDPSVRVLVEALEAIAAGGCSMRTMGGDLVKPCEERLAGLGLKKYEGWCRGCIAARALSASSVQEAASSPRGGKVQGAESSGDLALSPQSPVGPTCGEYFQAGPPGLDMPAACQREPGHGGRHGAYVCDVAAAAPQGVPLATPEVLKRRTPEELAAHVPLSREAISAAIEEGQRQRLIALGHLDTSAAAAPQGVPPAAAELPSKEAGDDAVARLGIDVPKWAAEIRERVKAATPESVRPARTAHEVAREAVLRAEHRFQDDDETFRVDVTVEEVAAAIEADRRDRTGELGDDLLIKVCAQVLAIPTLAPGEELAEPMDDAVVAAVLDMKKELDAFRAAARASMRTAREVAHSLTSTCRYDGSPGVPHSRNCDNATEMLAADRFSRTGDEPGAVELLRRCSALVCIKVSREDPRDASTGDCGTCPPCAVRAFLHSGEARKERTP